MRLLVHLPSGAVMPVAISDEASVAALRETVRTLCGLPIGVTGRLGFALGHAALDEGRSLRGDGTRW